MACAAFLVYSIISSELFAIMEDDDADMDEIEDTIQSLVQGFSESAKAVNVLEIILMEIEKAKSCQWIDRWDDIYL
jgi:hypothetical protein